LLGIQIENALAFIRNSQRIFLAISIH